MQTTRRDEAAQGLSSRSGARHGNGSAAATVGTAGAGAGNSRAAAGAAPGTVTAAPAPAPASAPASAGLLPLQQKLQQHIDREDKRILVLTEAILYDFLPRALRAAAGGEDLARELTPDKSRAAAGAALAVAALMNAPPGFLEFLLCVPWSSLGQMYPGGGGGGGGGGEGGAGAGAPPASFFDWSATGVLGASAGAADDAPGSPALAAGPAGATPGPRAPGLPWVPQLEASREERAAIVNLPLDPALMDCVLGFLLREEHAESLPPMMRVTADVPPGARQEPDPPGAVTRDTVAALLDGATSLHCAAIRGNPAQVDHLLQCGANPLATNAAGEMPVENVPVCGDCCVGGKLSCRCMGPRDQEAWECRSRLARTLILRRCIVSWGRRGVRAWLRVVALCLLCLLGLWGHHTSLRRPALEAQAAVRRERRRQAALQRAQATLLKMRTNVSSGRELLSRPGGGGGGAAAGEAGGGGGSREPPEPGEGREGSGNGGGSGGGGGNSRARQEGHALAESIARAGAEEQGPEVCSLLGGEGGPEGGGSYRLGAGAGGCRGAQGAFEHAERAYGCFTAAVDLLQAGAAA